jgi:hypothetical protein
MAKVTKPQFEQYLHELKRDRKPAPMRIIQQFAPRVEKLLEDTGEILVQKSTKVVHPDAMLELTATWLSAQGDVDGAIADIEPLWPGDVFDTKAEKHAFIHRDENVILAFGAELPDNQFLTGRVIIIL